MNKVNKGLACRKCGDIESWVRDTRARQGAVIRRRVCKTCSSRYCTIERLRDGGDYSKAETKAERELRELQTKVDTFMAAFEALRSPVMAGHPVYNADSGDTLEARG